MTVTRPTTAADVPLAEFAVCGWPAAGIAPAVVFHVRAHDDAEALALAATRPAAAGLTLTATRIRAQAPPPAGVVHEGPWP